MQTSMEILVRATLSRKDSNEVNRLATELGKTPEEVIREAVRFYSRKCVPTHSRRRG